MRARSEDDSLRMLLDSRVDYALMDALVVQYIVATYPEEARTRLQIGAAPLVTRSLHLAIRRSLPDADSIIERFNAQLRAMITDRTYHRLLHVEWIRADIDGDGVPEYVAESDKVGQDAAAERLQPVLPAGARRRRSTRNRSGTSSAARSTTAGRRCRIATRWTTSGRTDAVHPTARIFTFSWK